MEKITAYKMSIDEYKTLIAKEFGADSYKEEDMIDASLVRIAQNNNRLVKNAEKTINEMINLGGKVWFSDENGNNFVPKGNITINFVQPFEKRIT